MSATGESASKPTTTANPPSAPALGNGFAWTIVELAPDGIVVTDDDGRIVMVNRHVESLFGYDRDALIGAQVDILLPARFRRTHAGHRAQYVSAPRMRLMGTGMDLFGCRADGSEFPVEVSLSPAATDRGIATVVIVRDVTEQRTLESAARTASAGDNDDRIAADLNDRVINHLFGCGLTLASVIGRNQLDDHIAARLYGVIDELDAAVKQIRDTVFARLESPTEHDT